MQKNYSQSHRRFRIKHQNEHISIQAMIIDPIVQILRYINARWIDKYNVIS